MITILFQTVRFLVVLFEPVLIPIQISEINSVLSINHTPRTESENYTVSDSHSGFAGGALAKSTRIVHLTSVTDTRRTHTIISSGEPRLHFPDLFTPLMVLLPSSRLHFEIESEDGRLYVITPCSLVMVFIVVPPRVHRPCPFFLQSAPIPVTVVDPLHHILISCTCIRSTPQGEVIPSFWSHRESGISASRRIS
jgi:hypothetical protein